MNRLDTEARRLSGFGAGEGPECYSGKGDPAEREALRAKLLAPDRASGSEILLRTLLLEGVECVFGYPGGAVLYIYDAMHGNPHFRHILTRHEQGAIHAADGYARATGKIAFVWRRRDRERPIWLRASRRRIWIRSRWS